MELVLVAVMIVLVGGMLVDKPRWLLITMLVIVVGVTFFARTYKVVKVQSYKALEIDDLLKFKTEKLVTETYTVYPYSNRPSEIYFKIEENNE